MSNIGVKIKIQREKKHLTQVQLGELLHVSDKTVSKWEKGNSNPSYEILEEMSKIFEVKIEYFLKDNNVESKFKVGIKISFEFIKHNWHKMIFTLLFAILAIYFINTYDTLEMYEIKTTDGIIAFDSGYYFKSKNKIIISINNIKYENNDNDIIDQTLKLYALDDNEKIPLYESTEFDNVMYKDFIGYNITRSLARHLDKCLYLEIENIHKDNSITTDKMKLTLKKTISSDSILYKDKLNIENKYDYNKNYNIDGFLLKNNKFTNIKDTYVYYKNIDGNTIYFDIKANKIFYTLIKNDDIEKIDYFYNKNQIAYINEKNNIVLNKYAYYKNEDNLICMKGNCDNYLEKYDAAIAKFNEVYASLSKS